MICCSVQRSPKIFISGLNPLVEQSSFSFFTYVKNALLSKVVVCLVSFSVGKNN